MVCRGDWEQIGYKYILIIEVSVFILLKLRLMILNNKFPYLFNL